MTFLENRGGFESTIGAEILTYIPDLQQVAIVSGDTQIQFLDISDPTNPVEAGSPLDITSLVPEAAGVNSVAYSNGLLALAIEVEPATANGFVAIVDVNALGGPIAAEAFQVLEAGALPDMVTFTPDGTKALVANEGEPSDDYTVDPEGSISIVDVSGGIGSATMTTADFGAFNADIDTLRAEGVRIFGPGATVAQDLEPEYITVSDDSTTAYVALQENNALAVVDIASSTVTDILPLGTKDFNQGLETFFFDEAALPVLGTSDARGDIRLSGFSGLFYEGVNPDNGNLMFVTHPDRGPDDGRADVDGDGVNDDNRVFLLPDLQPQLVKFELDPNSGALNITERVFLTDQAGNPLSGRPNLPTDDGGRTPINEDLEELPLDPLGADLEGVVRVPDGSYWMVDEYRPAIYHFEADGTLIDRFVPAGLPPELGTGALPEVYNTRRDNRGFEAVAYEDGKIYAFIQTPMNNPDSGASMTIRILAFDTDTATTVGEYLYLQEDMGGGSDKIGDAVSLGNGEFLVIERDSNVGVESQKALYQISLDGATNLQTLPADFLATGETFESLTPEELANRGVQVVSKDIYADLAQLGYGFTDKPEGLAALGNGTFAVLNDNDFGETGIPIGLGIINLDNAIDASNEDGGINIRNWPALGMYQPDAIASYSVGGETYIVTANEGDARDYGGFSEEARVADVTLDPTAFPNATELQLEENLGRLKITTTLGDTDGDGDYDELYAYGARSFSIWNSAGEQVFDSANDFERITAEQVPEIFNSNGGVDSFDNRSDDKGAEPEALTLAEIDGITYAFIGLERTGGIMAYNISDPTAPEFIDYLDYLNDAPGNSAPEGFQFIPASSSPNGEDLLIVANEESNTLQVFNVDTTVNISDIQGAGHTSPLNGEPVTAVPGIVTAVDSNGFYFQDPVGDGNIATSEALFVFTGGEPTVAVGDSIQVSGTVSEFFPGGEETGNLSTTQISSVSEITVISSGNPLPEAILIGGGGRIPPSENIDDDAFTSFAPETDGIDFFESLEAMRVTANDAVAVAGTNRFGEIFTVVDNGASATGISQRGTLNISPNDFNPEKVQVDEDSGVFDFEFPDVNVGDSLGDVTGVIGYSFGNFEIIPTEDFTASITAAGLAPEVTTIEAADDELTVASYNVLNLDPNDGDGDTDVANGRFDAIAQQIVNSLNAPDVVSLQEIQDNSGSEDDGTIAADVTLQTLVDAISAAGGPAYEFIDNTFIGDNTSGGQPGGNIRTAFLYNPERVSLVEGSVQTIGSQEPGGAFEGARLPLVANFQFNGEAVTVVNNHFSSKGGSSPILGVEQPFEARQEEVLVNGSLDERLAQSAAVQAFVADTLAANSDAKMVVLGDLNEFEFISPVTGLEAVGLTNLVNTLPENERYSFIFQGNSQSLDHILVSNNIAGGAQFDTIHTNVEFAETPQRASDHEPLLVSLDLDFQGGTESFLSFEQYGAAVSALGIGEPFAPVEISGIELTDFVDEVYYLSNNPDVAAAVASGAIANGYTHFVNFGINEGRAVNALFDRDAYLAANPDVAAAVETGAISSGVFHYLSNGHLENRAPGGSFNPANYLASNPDVAAAVAAGAFVSPFEHALEFGVFEGRFEQSLLFDEASYLGANPDVADAVAAGAIASGLAHYVGFGSREGRPADVQFDEAGYLAANPDVAAAVETGGLPSGFAHFLAFGVAEGRPLA